MMKINYVLDEVFSARSNIEIMRVLQNSLLGLTGREVSRASGLSPRASHSTLSVLETLGIVKRVRGGRDHIFSLNREHYIVNSVVLPALSEETNYKKSIFNEISRKLRKITAAVYLFGSVARKEENLSSDFDVCIIYEEKSKRELIENLVFELKSELNKKYSVSISPVYFTVNEFRKNYNHNNSLVPEIVKDAVLISGISAKEILDGKAISESKSR